MVVWDKNRRGEALIYEGLMNGRSLKRDSINHCAIAPEADACNILLIAGEDACEYDGQLSETECDLPTVFGQLSCTDFAHKIPQFNSYFMYSAV